MAVARGRVSVVQEQRFRLLTDRGQSYLLTLAQGSGLSERDLCQLRDEGTHVRVEYDGRPGMATGIARSIETA